MRWSDLYVGLMAVTFGFGAFMFRLEGGAWSGTLALVAVAVVMLALMARRVARTPTVALVGDPRAGRMNRLQDALEDQGFSTRSCAGVSVHACPVLEGKPCTIGGHPVGVVIFDPANYDGAVPPCGDALHVPWLTVHDGTAWKPVVGHGQALIGSAEGPEAAARTMGELLDVSK